MSKTENKIREKAPEEKQDIVTAPPQKGNKVVRSVVSVVSGSFLSHESTMKKLPFIFFLCFVALCYIAVGYYADDQVRKVNTLTSEIKELRTQYIVVKDSLVIKSKQTEVARALDKMQTGIKESVVPPKKIIVKQNSKQASED